jgi:hypothetical protein
LPAEQKITAGKDPDRPSSSQQVDSAGDPLPAAPEHLGVQRGQADLGPHVDAVVDQRPLHQRD